MNIQESGYQEIASMFPNFDGKLYLYISGSQGVANADMVIQYGVDFKNLEDVTAVFCEFIDENVWENIDDYLDDCDGDEEEAFGEALADSGYFYIGVDEFNMLYEFDGGIYTLREELE